MSEAADRTVAVVEEPRLHSHVSDALPTDHPLATTRVYCDRCDTLLHRQANSCMRTWLETGCDNFCLGCFIVVAGGLTSPGDDIRLAGADYLTRNFGLPARELAASQAAPRLPPVRRRRGSDLAR